MKGEVMKPVNSADNRINIKQILKLTGIESCKQIHQGHNHYNSVFTYYHTASDIFFIILLFSHFCSNNSYHFVNKQIT